MKKWPSIADIVKTVSRNGSGYGVLVVALVMLPNLIVAIALAFRILR